MAFLILHVKRPTSMSAYGTALLDTLNTTSKDYIIIFLSSLPELFMFTESLALGQHTLLGNLNVKCYITRKGVSIYFDCFTGPWFESYLSTTKPSDDNEILQTVLCILQRLKYRAVDQPRPFSNGKI